MATATTAAASSGSAVLTASAAAPEGARVCPPLLGDSAAARALREVVAELSDRGTPALFEGERGTGREHLARHVHLCSARRAGAFIRIDAEFVDTERAERKLSRAHGGTLLVKDLAHADARMRRVLLHHLLRGALEPHEQTPRVLISTDVELPRLLDAGLLDGELVAALQPRRITVGPLRERVADIPRLCDHFLVMLAAQCGGTVRALTARAADQLSRYSWPGNLAELRDVIRRAALRARGTAIDLGDIEAVLPPLHERVPLEELSLEDVVRAKLRGLLMRLEGYPIDDLYEQVLDRIERPLLAEVLQRTSGNQIKAAEMLGINRNTLRAKLLQRGLRTPAVPSRPVASRDGGGRSARRA